MNLIEKFSAIDFGAMGTVTIVWIALPFLLGFTIFLLPKLDRMLSWLGVFVSTAYAIRVFLEPSPTALQLLDNFGNTLMIDPLAGYFLLTNALVTAAVIFYSWRDGRKSYFFFAQTLLLHGSLNAAFVCTDFISEYVALEVSGIAAFLLIAYPRSDRSLWVALRYLFISNVAMLFYLIGAVLAYQTNHSFRFDALAGAPPEAVALIMLGLLVKGVCFRAVVAVYPFGGGNASVGLVVGGGCESGHLSVAEICADDSGIRHAHPNFRGGYYLARCVLCHV
jgi:multicomponent Na+:H+ antiporter subunit D